jgi:hypothetical protein
MRLILISLLADRAAESSEGQKQMSQAHVTNCDMVHKKFAAGHSQWQPSTF